MQNSLFIFIAIFIVAQGWSQNEQLMVASTFNGFHCDGKPGLCAIDSVERNSNSNSTLEFHHGQSITLRIQKNRLSEQEFFNLFSTAKNQMNIDKTYYLQIPDNFTLENPNPKDSNDLILNLVEGSYPIEITETHYILQLKTF